MRLSVFALLLAAAATAADTDPKGGKSNEPREIKAASFKVSGKPSRGPRPTKINSMRELANAFPDKDARDDITRQVDFRREYLVLFHWQGSGGDKVFLKVEKSKGGPELTFTVERGRTRDLRRHVKLYVLPNRVALKNVTGDR